METQKASRWDRLRNAIRKKHLAPSNEPSAMSMFSFHTAVTHVLKETPARQTDYEWIEYTLPNSKKSLQLHQRKAQCSLSIQELAVQNVDNTGNIRTWPCEDLMGRYVSERLQSSSNGSLRVIELGAGMCGVAGLRLAAELPTKCLSKIILTDGNVSCVENLRITVDANVQHQRIPRDSVDVRLLEWSSSFTASEEVFDVIIASDCLFFESFHDALVHTLHELLAPSGTIYLLQPSRGGSLERFVDLAQKRFNVLVESTFDPQVTAQHTKYQTDPLYQSSIHQPVLVTLHHLTS